MAFEKNDQATTFEKLYNKNYTDKYIFVTNNNLELLDTYYNSFINFIKYQKDIMDTSSYLSYNEKASTLYDLGYKGIYSLDTIQKLYKEFKEEIVKDIYKIENDRSIIIEKNEKKEKQLQKKVKEYDDAVIEFMKLFNKHRNTMCYVKKEYFKNKIIEYRSQITSKNNKVNEIYSLTKILEKEVNDYEVIPLTKENAINEIKKSYNIFLDNAYNVALDVLDKNESYLIIDFNDIKNHLNDLYENLKDKPCDLQVLKDYTLEIILKANTNHLKIDKENQKKLYLNQLEKLLKEVHELELTKAYYKLDDEYCNRVKNFKEIVFGLTYKIEDNLEDNIINYHAANIQISRMIEQIINYKTNIIKELEGIKTSPIILESYLYYKNDNDYSKEYIDEFGKILTYDKHNDDYHTHKYTNYKEQGSTTSNCHCSLKCNNDLCRVGKYVEYDGTVFPPLEKDLNIGDKKIIVWHYYFGKYYKNGEFIGYVYLDKDTNNIEPISDFDFNIENFSKTKRLI